MLLSKASEDAIRLVFYLMDHDNEDFVRIKTIAKELDLPYFQLAKIAQYLIQNGILVSRTGPKGGIVLKRKPDEIRLMDIVSSIEDKNFLNQCVLGIGSCGTHNPCPIHYYWEETKDKIIDMFQNRSLKELKKLDLLRQSN
jgi:Rrf2 family protein